LKSSDKLHKASAGLTLDSGGESFRGIRYTAFDIVYGDADITVKADLKSLVSAGVKGFKCFLIESGVEVREQ
jgi:hypothetical protein